MKFSQQNKYRNQDSGPKGSSLSLKTKFTMLNKKPTTPRYNVNSEQRLLQRDIVCDMKNLMKQSKLHYGPESTSFKYYVIM